MRIKKIAPVTPANGNIENSYGTSQENTYSQEYINGITEYSNVPVNLNSDFTAYRLFCRKVGKLVHFHFQGYANSDKTGFFTIVTNLPKIYTSDYPIIAWTQDNIPNANPTGTRYLWMNPNGGLQGYTISKEKYIIVDLTYITTD